MNPNNPISSIMTTKLVTVTPNDFLARVTKIFESNGFHHIPVVADGNRLVGIISKEDFQKMNFYFFDKMTSEDGTKAKEGLRASDIMTPYPLSIDPDDSIGLAADIFLANRFHALPVIEDKELVGLVTSHDLIEYAFTAVAVPKAREEAFFE
ncbi:MAG: CBS domain-containing protein [Bacteroidota bacterium]